MIIRRLFLITMMVLIPAAAFVSCRSFLNTKEDFKNADLHGMIYDAHNQMCSGVQLLIDGTRGPLTDVNGRFTIYDLSKGAHEVTLKKQGYEEA
ncbi:MAG TPA: hypothetical protein ENN69_06235, partial [Spirochaetia bacterium]|nr:hypothetical protein [Spirochaetia bacterium]